ncbi:MAG: Rrf2 family transcriptional regulator [Eudoraea sp.]|nr:Rrf2 family transcriptional regulator [Eudoraea sp.]
MLSNSSKYALKAVLYLTQHSNENKKLMVKEISEAVDVPKAYLAKLLQELSKNSLISATKGPKGGYFITPENKQLRLFSIIEVIDGLKRIEMCVLGLEQCNEHAPCPLHRYVSAPKSELLDTFKKMTLQQLCDDIAQQKSHFPL